MAICQGFSAKTHENAAVFHSHNSIGVPNLSYHCLYFPASDIITMLTGG